MVWISKFSQAPNLNWNKFRSLAKTDGDESSQGPLRDHLDAQPAALAGLVAAPLQISARQLECLAWVAEGKSAIEIGIILGISDRTVEKHIARACEIFGVNRRIQAVDYARRLGLITVD